MQAFKKLSQGYRHLALWSLSGSIFLIVIVMPYQAFLSTWLGTAIGPYLVWKSWKEILLVLMVLAAVGFAFMRPKLAKRILLQPLVLSMLAFSGFMIILALLYQHPLLPTAAGLLFDLRFLALFVLAQVVLLAWPHRAEKLRRWLTIGLLVSTAVVSIIAVLQVTVLPKDVLAMFGYEKDVTIAPFITIDQQSHALRAFSTLSGPNPFGMFLLLPLAMSAIYIVRRKYLKLALPAFALGFVALFLTGSRSAWLGAIAAALALGAVLLGRERLFRYARRYGLYAVAAIMLLGIASVTYAPLRLAIFHSSPGDPSLIEGSTANHFEATARGIADAAGHPLGRGPGQAGPASYYGETGRIAENYYVQVAQEGGVLALILFLIILYLIARKLWRAATQPNAPPLALGLLASFLGIAVINLLLHGWADGPVSLIWWGLAGLLLPLDNERHG